MHFHRHAILKGMLACILGAGGCQLLSGLDDLELERGEGGNRSSTSSSSTGAAGAGGAGGSAPCPAPCIAIWAAASSNISRLAMGTSYLYWLEGKDANAGIFKIPLASGPPVRVAGPQSISRFGVEVSDVYMAWTQTGTDTGVYGIFTGDTASVHAIEVPGVNGANYKDIAMTTAYAFWHDSMKASISRASTATWLLESVDSSGAVFYGDGFASVPLAQMVYWLDSKGIRYSIGTPVNSVGLIAGSETLFLANAFGLAVDSAFIYWTAGDINGSINAFPIMGGVAESLISLGGRAFPRSILSTGTQLYWFDALDATCANSVLYSTALPLSLGSAPVVLRSGIPCPTNLVQDSGHIYWATGSAIYRMPKTNP